MPKLYLVVDVFAARLTCLIFVQLETIAGHPVARLRNTVAETSHRVKLIGGQGLLFLSKIAHNSSTVFLACMNLRAIQHLQERFYFLSRYYTTKRKRNCRQMFQLEEQ